MGFFRRLRCRLGIHDWDYTDHFKFCTRPNCRLVMWFTGQLLWDLDICDTHQYWESIVVYEG